ncbi:MAG: domain 2 [Flaviaesturariibacter sp.]|nr:domain 2 [Flaviaesturariibacter sp.]
MHYYIRRNVERMGPYTLNALKEQLLTLEEEVQKEGSSEWVPAKELPELYSVFMEHLASQLLTVPLKSKGHTLIYKRILLTILLISAVGSVLLGYQWYDTERGNRDYFLILLSVSLLFFAICVTIVMLYLFPLTVNEDAGKNEVVKSEFPHFERAVYDLDGTIKKYNFLGGLSFVMTVFALILLGGFIFHLFEKSLEDIKNQTAGLSENHTTLTFVFIILRTSLLGAFIITFILQAYRFTNSCFDQAVRFNKRKHASYFLIQIFSSLGPGEITSDNLEKIMHGFREWNVNVESAFTQSKRSKSAMAPGRFIELLEKLIAQKTSGSSI